MSWKALLLFLLLLQHEWFTIREPVLKAGVLLAEYAHVRNCCMAWIHLLSEHCMSLLHIFQGIA